MKITNFSPFTVRLQFTSGAVAQPATANRGVIHSLMSLSEAKIAPNTNKKKRASHF
jgi:hypothetical protein